MEGIKVGWKEGDAETVGGCWEEGGYRREVKGRDRRTRAKEARHTQSSHFSISCERTKALLAEDQDFQRFHSGNPVKINKKLGCNYTKRVYCFIQIGIKGKEKSSQVKGSVPVRWRAAHQQPPKGLEWHPSHAAQQWPQTQFSLISVLCSNVYQRNETAEFNFKHFIFIAVEFVLL